MSFPVFGQLFGNRFGRVFGQGGGSSNRWRLLDQFTTPRAAGSVNGTPADGTGQIRTVVDTNLKLAVTNNTASFSTGGVTNGNPGIWYPQMTRLPGLALFTRINYSTIEDILFGWDTDQISVPAANGIYSRTGGVFAYDAATPILVAPVLVTATNYDLSTILRTAGAWLLVKGGIYTNWELLWPTAVNSNAGLFPNLSGKVLSVFTTPNIRSPITLYILQPLAYDTFTRANGALGSSEAVGPDAQVLVPLVWNFSVGKWAIVTNKAVGTPAQGADVVVNGSFATDTDWTKGAGWAIAAGLATAAAASSNLTAIVAPLTLGVWYQTVYDLSGFVGGTVRIRVGGTNMPTHAANATYTETNRAGGTSLVFVGAGFTGSLDNVTCKALTLADLFSSVLVSSADVWYEVGITLPSATGGVQGGIVCNLDNTAAPANFIIAYLDGAGNVLVDECVAGVYTNKLAATAVTYVANAPLRVMRSGTQMRVFYNNLAVGGALTMSANVNKNVGNFATSPLVSFDNALCWARGTSGEYSGLDAFNVS